MTPRVVRRAAPGRAGASSRLGAASHSVMHPAAPLAACAPRRLRAASAARLAAPRAAGADGALYSLAGPDGKRGAPLTFKEPPANAPAPEYWSLPGRTPTSIDDGVLNRYSARITQPKSQGASQAMLYATGIVDKGGLNLAQARGNRDPPPPPPPPPRVQVEFSAPGGG